MQQSPPGIAPRRLVILAQFDPQNGLPPHVAIHLERLRPIAARVVLVSNSPLLGNSRELAATLCDQVVERKNTGWDFAAWRDVLKSEQSAKWDSVILTNSSVVGPLFPLQPIVDRMEEKAFDFWGMVESHELGMHLQSYFLSFSRKVTASDTWSAFWASVEDLEDKLEVIMRYEIKLTTMMQDAGFTCGAVIDKVPGLLALRILPRQIFGRYYYVPRNLNSVNRSLLDNKQLIQKGMPYLKASLLWGEDTRFCSPIPEIDAVKLVDYPWARIGIKQ